MTNLEWLLDQSQRVKRWPTKPKEKTLVIEYLAEKFELGREYSEPEVNTILNTWHTFQDSALLCRELFGRGFLDRTTNGSRYWKKEPTGKQ